MNPFFQYNELPDYASIIPERADQALSQLLQDAKSRLAQLEKHATPTWEGCMAPRYELTDPLSYAWGIVSHMLNAMNSKEWRNVHEKHQPQIIAFYSEIGQSQSLYKAMHHLSNCDAHKQLTEAQKRVLANDLRDAIHAGAAVPPETRATLTSLREKNADDSSAFMNHVLDASKAVVLTLTSKQDVAGLPASLLSTASESAQRNGHPESTSEKGPWVITHEAPLFVPFMQYSERRDLRETLYRAYITRASEGELNNQPLITNILKRRREIARLLGFETYADLKLESRMAQSVQAVQTLIERITTAAKPAAQADCDTLEKYARKHGQSEALAPWDVAFWSERLRKERFALDTEALRPYFPFPRVLDCLFETVKDLFDVTITPADGKTSVWHPDVRFFEVQDHTGTCIAHLYLDPYSRPDTKRGGAWMDEVLSRNRNTDGSIRLPAALMVCNQSRPTEGKPALMTLSEVTTLYHECGHALHHILTEVDLAAAAGINNVEWDAVELPSQFMENWVYHRPYLKRMTKHADTGKPLPDALIDQIIASRWFQEGYQTLRQIFFSALDLGLHDAYAPDSKETPDDYKMRIAPQYTVIPPLPEDRFLCGFSHIFSGGYAAGYYSYKWAEVLAADAFAAFEEAGLDNTEAIAKTGRHFRNTVLAWGGSKHPMDVFKAFRGREPDPDALLRQSGLQNIEPKLRKSDSNRIK